MLPPLGFGNEGRRAVGNETGSGIGKETDTSAGRNQPSIRALGRAVAQPVIGAALALAVVAAGSLGLGPRPERAEPARLAAAPSAFAQATPMAGEAATADACPDELYGPGAEPWVRAELYFGMSSADGDVFAQEEFLAFMDAEITPRFPDGLTLLSGIGQWQGDQGIIQQRSQLLIILYPAEFGQESSALLEEIRDEYEEQFRQESVLRADSYPVCTSF